MEFFGLRVKKWELEKGIKKLHNRQKPSNEFKETEVYIKLFNEGEWINENEIVQIEKQLIRAYLIGHRSAAHFTHYRNNDLTTGDTEPVLTAAKFLLDKLKTNLYDKTEGAVFSTDWKPYKGASGSLENSDL